MNNELNIFFATDDNFVQHLCVALVSILENSDKDDNLNFYIMTKGLTNNNIKILNDLKNIRNCNLEIIKIDNDKFKHFISPNYINSTATFYRYLIPILKPDLNKVLYLDCDIVVKSSLRNLYNIDLEDYYIAGVEDCHYNCAQAKIKPLFDINEPYFNAGVLLFNCEKMRNNNFSQKCFELTEQLDTRIYTGADQDVLNILCKGCKKIIPPKYNLISAMFDSEIISGYTRQEIEEALQNPIIVHFTDRIKPWTMIQFPLNKYSYEYFKYLKKTPFYNSKLKYKLFLGNIKTAKAVQRLKKNIVVKFIFYLFVLPINILNLLGSLLYGFKAIQEYNKRV